MKLPRNLSGAQFTKALDGLGYLATRQACSHVRLTSFTRGEHHVEETVNALRAMMESGKLPPRSTMRAARSVR